MDLKKLARRLRKNMTHEEVKLWVQLQFLNKQGYHFRRQAPLDGYVLDFVEFNQRLIIEIDGSQHGEPEGIIRDRLRDTHFEAAGFQILRFWNFEINREMDGVVTKILSLLKEPPPSASRPPPP